MNTHPTSLRAAPSRPTAAGFALIEVLVAAVILAAGLVSLALLQMHRTTTCAIGFGLPQQPFGTSRLSVLGEAADGQCGLLSVGFGNVQQHGLHTRRAALHTRPKGIQGHAPQLHRSLCDGVYRAGQVQQGGSGLQPTRAIHNTQLVLYRGVATP